MVDVITEKDFDPKKAFSIKRIFSSYNRILQDVEKGIVESFEMLIITNKSLDGVLRKVIESSSCKFTNEFINGKIRKKEIMEFYLKFENICKSKTKDVLDHLRFQRKIIDHEKNILGIGKEYYELFKNMLKKNIDDSVPYNPRKITKSAIYNLYGFQNIVKDVNKVVLYDNEFYELITKGIFFPINTTFDEKKSNFLSLLNDLLKTDNIYNVHELNLPIRFNLTNLNLDVCLHMLDKSENVLSDFILKGINYVLKEKYCYRIIEIIILTHNHEIINEFSIISNEKDKITSNLIEQIRRIDKFYYPGLRVEIMLGGFIAGKLVYPYCKSKINYFISLLSKESIYSYGKNEIENYFKKNTMDFFKLICEILQNYKHESLTNIIQDINDLITIFSNNDFLNHELSVKMKRIRDFLFKTDFMFKDFEKLKKLD